MKPDIHPNRGPVLYHDVSCNKYFLINGVVPKNAETAVWEEDGQEYPLIRVEVSSASHPFYTGSQRLHTSDGRIAKFQQRFGKTSMAGGADKKIVEPVPESEPEPEQTN